MSQESAGTVEQAQDDSRDAAAAKCYLIHMLDGTENVTNLNGKGFLESYGFLGEGVEVSDEDLQAIAVESKTELYQQALEHLEGAQTPAQKKSFAKLLGQCLFVIDRKAKENTNLSDTQRDWPLSVEGQMFLDWMQVNPPYEGFYRDVQRTKRDAHNPGSNHLRHALAHLMQRSRAASTMGSRSAAEGQTQRGSSLSGTGFVGDRSRLSRILTALDSQVWNEDAHTLLERVRSKKGRSAPT
jgi:hypothetical protein